MMIMMVRRTFSSFAFVAPHRVQLTGTTTAKKSVEDKEETACLLTYSHRGTAIEIGKEKRVVVKTHEAVVRTCFFFILRFSATSSSSLICIRLSNDILEYISSLSSHAAGLR